MVDSGGAVAALLLACWQRAFPGMHAAPAYYLAAPILRELPLVFRDGCAQIGDAPGVGLAWDEDAVAHYAVAG